MGVIYGHVHSIFIPKVFSIFMKFGRKLSTTGGQSIINAEIPILQNCLSKSKHPIYYYIIPKFV
jgi:hypothetical protein